MDNVFITTNGGLDVPLDEIRKPSVERTNPEFWDAQVDPFMLTAETAELGKFIIVCGSKQYCEQVRDTLLKAVVDANLPTHFDFTGKRDTLPHFSQEERYYVT